MSEVNVVIVVAKESFRKKVLVDQEVHENQMPDNVSGTINVPNGPVGIEELYFGSTDEKTMWFNDNKDGYRIEMKRMNPGEPWGFDGTSLKINPATKKRFP